ncbi:MAG: hypothetical protein RLO11_13090 [Salinisphaeraceae bacterium]
MDMIDKVEEKVSDRQGSLMAVILVLELMIFPVLGWIGLTLWGLNDRIASTAETSAVISQQQTLQYEYVEQRLGDHESRIRRLESDR